VRPEPLPDDQAALLAAIVAAPDEDTPRLAYADWLDEHGDAGQAAFVRESVRLSRSERPADRTAIDRLHRSAEDHARDWLSALGLPGAEDASFDRGLPAGVCYYDGNSLLAEVDTLLARLPVRDLGLSAQDGKLRHVAGLPELFVRPGLARLEVFRIGNGGGPLPPGTWAALLGCPHLGGLRELWLNGCELDNEHLFELAASPRFERLTALDLSENPYTFMGQFAVLRSKHLRGLRELSLWNGEDPEDQGLIELVRERFGSDDPLRYDLADQRVTR
jgi:uncharacterized protein (TIGR02996 family)